MQVFFIGLKDGTTKEIFADAIKQGTAEYHCNRVKSKAGSSVLVESGSFMQLMQVT